MPNEPQTGRPQETQPQDQTVKTAAPPIRPQAILPTGQTGHSPTATLPPRSGAAAPPTGGAAPTPLPPTGPRTYDAKGHASDGSQSTGLDNPWKIGANIGMTYDHDTIAELALIADNKKAGSISKEEAAWILNTVGFQPDGQPNYEERWAASRKLDRYAQNGGGTSPWWHDPINSPDAETTRKLGGRYANEQEALDNYGWWNTQGNTPNRRGANNAPDPTAMPGTTTTGRSTSNPFPTGDPLTSPPPSSIANFVRGQGVSPNPDNIPDTIPDPTQMPDLQRRGPITIPPELQVSQDAFWQRYR